MKKGDVARNFRAARDAGPVVSLKNEGQEKPQADTFTVYVDGSSLGNPGPSGWCVLIIFPSGRRETLCGGRQYSTNNRMELHAAISALGVLPADGRGAILSDAQYVVKGVNEWRTKWEANGWRNSQKKPVENADLWQTLYKLRDERPGVSFEWVKGHGADAENAYVDRMARAEAERQRQRQRQRQALIAEKAQAKA